MAHGIGKSCRGKCVAAVTLSITGGLRENITARQGAVPNRKSRDGQGVVPDRSLTVAALRVVSDWAVRRDQ